MKGTTMRIPCYGSFPTICILTTLAGSLEVQAHDLAGLVAEQNSLDPQTRAKFQDMNDLRRRLAEQTKSQPPDGQLEAVVQRALRWPTNKVTVCFFDGEQRARDHVAEVAADWTKSTALQFDFGPTSNRRSCTPNSPSDIRVSFRGSGYWSYVGIQAKDIQPYKQTLNLQDIDRVTNFTPREDGIIRHEFGHAIGFEHEHQSPASGCEEEFNWSYLYVALGWPKDEVDRNMRRLDTSSGMNGLLTTSFDRQSVMLYSLSPEAFKNPGTAKCYIQQPNNDISTVDRRATETVYPSMATKEPSPPAAMRGASASPEAAAIARSVKRLKELTGQDTGR